MLCTTRVARIDRHAQHVRRPGRMWISGVTLIASILFALAVVPRQPIALPADGRDRVPAAFTNYTIEDFAAAAH